MNRIIKKISDWWDDRNDFEQFWLFWFVVALIGLGLVKLFLFLFGGEG